MYYTCTQIVDEIRQHINRPHEFVEEFVNFYKCYVLSSSPIYTYFTLSSFTGGKLFLPGSWYFMWRYGFNMDIQLW